MRHRSDVMKGSNSPPTERLQDEVGQHKRRQRSQESRIPGQDAARLPSRFTASKPVRPLHRTICGMRGKISSSFVTSMCMKRSNQCVLVRPSKEEIIDDDSSQTMLLVLVCEMSLIARQPEYMQVCIPDFFRLFTLHPN